MKTFMKSKTYWILLLVTIIGEFLLPWILEQCYSEYNGMTMVMSVLGSPQSPVHLIYNLWLIWLGVFLTITAIIYFLKIRSKFPVLAILILLSIGVFAIGSGFISGIFSVNESKDVVTIASKIHGVSAALGFMTLLFFPLLNGIVSFKQKDSIRVTISVISFVLALIFFVCFVMGDKDQFQNTILKYEGLWQRLALAFMYIPLVYDSVLMINKSE